MLATEAEVNAARLSYRENNPVKAREHLFRAIHRLERLPPSYSQGAYNSYDRPDDGYYRDSRYGDRDRDYDRRDGYTYESERSYSVTDGRADANGCTLAESPIYLPDGRTQKRFVRVCPDASGRYQVVD